jgi:hypothetical protein
MADDFTINLAVSRAEIPVDKKAGLTSDEELTLEWPNFKVPAGLRKAAINWLYENYVYLQDPVIGGKPHSGRYRSVNADVAEGGYLRLTLRKGYITSLVADSTLDWTEARLMDAKGYVAGVADIYSIYNTGANEPENYVTAIWPNISPSHVETIKASIEGLSSFDPTIKGQSYGTGLHRLHVDSRIEEDGSATIVLFMASPEFCLKGMSDWETKRSRTATFYWNVPKELAQGLIEFHKARGASCTPSYNGEKGLVDIVVYEKVYQETILKSIVTMQNCDATEYTDMYLGVYDYSLYNPMSPPAGVTYFRDVNANDDGSYDIIFKMRVRSLREYPFRRVADQTLQYIDQYAIKGSLDDGPEFESIPGTIYRKRIDIRDDCSRDVEIDAAVDRHYEKTFTSTRTRFSAGATLIIRNASDAPTLPSEMAGSGIYRVSLSMADNGLYDGSMEYLYGTNDGAAYFRHRSTMFRDGQSILYKSWPTSITAPVATGTGVYSVSQSLGDDGLYDGLLQYENGTNAGAAYFRSRSTMFRDGQTILYKSWPEVITAPEATGSGLYTVSQSLGEDGLYDGALQYENGTNSGAAYFRNRSTLFRTAHAILYKAWPTVIEAPEATGSGVYSVSQSLGEDGLYDGMLQYEQGLNTGAVYFKHASTLFRDGNSILYKSWPTSITAPSATGTGTYRVSQSLGEDGLYDGLLQYESGTGTGAAYFRNVSTLFRTGNAILYKSWPTVIESPEATGSGVYRVSQSMGEDGLYDGMLTYEYGLNTGEVAFSAQRSLFKAGNAILYKSWPEPIQAPDATGSGVYTVQQSLGDDGLYDGQMTYVYGTSADPALFTSRSTLFRTANAIIYKSWPTVISAPSATGSGSYSVTQSIGDDGLYDGLLQYEYGMNTGEAAFRSQSTLFRSANSILYKSWPTVIQAPEATGSGVYMVSQSLGEDGLYDGMLTYEYGTGTATVAFASASGSMRDQASILYRSWPVALASPEGGAGYSYRLEQTLGDDALYDARLVYEATSDGHAYFVGEEKVFSVTGVDIYRGSLSPDVVFPALTPGVSPSARVMMREDGLYDKQVSVDRALPGSVSHASERGPRRSTNSISYLNWPDPIIAPDAESGIYRAGFEMGRDGIYSGRLDYIQRSEEGIAEFEASDSGLVSAHRIIYDGVESPLTAPEASQGYIQQASNTLNDDGTYGGAMDAIYSHPATVAFVSRRTAFTDRNSLIYVASRSMIDVPSAITGPGVYEVTQRLNQDHTYDGSLTYEYGSNAGVYEFASVDSALREQVSIIYREVSTPVSAPDSVPGAIYSAENTLLENGLYSSRLEYAKSLAVAFNGVGSSNAFQTEYQYRYSNAPEPLFSAALYAPGAIYSGSSTVKDDGTYDGVYSMTVRPSRKIESFCSSYTKNQIIYTEKRNNVDLSEVTAITTWFGGLDYSINEAGLYDCERQLTYYPGATTWIAIPDDKIGLSEVEWEIFTDKDTGAVKARTILWAFDVYFFDDEGDAWDKISGTPTRSHVSRDESGLWRAVRYHSPADGGVVAL